VLNKHNILVLNLNIVKFITNYLFKIADVVLKLIKKVLLRNKNVYNIYIICQS